MEVQRIFIYPIKSLLPIEVNATEITNEGLRFDRQYVLVKTPLSTTPSETTSSTPPTSGSPSTTASKQLLPPPPVLVEHLTIKKLYQLILFQPSIDPSWSKLTITYKPTPSYTPVSNPNAPLTLTVPLTPSPLSLMPARTYYVSIFGTTALGVDMGTQASSYFSAHLNQPVSLLFIAGSGRRDIPGAAYSPEHYAPVLDVAQEYKLAPQRIRFADAAPLLVTSSASEEDVRRRFDVGFLRDEDVLIRLRPNIHVDVKGKLPAYDEDNWRSLSITSPGAKRVDQGASNGVTSDDDESEQVIVKCIFRCVRCLSLNADPETGQYAITKRQLYGLLASDKKRRCNGKFPHKPVFGQYAFAGPAGAIIRKGDIVEVTERTD